MGRVFLVRSEARRGAGALLLLHAHFQALRAISHCQSIQARDSVLRREDVVVADETIPSVLEHLHTDDTTEVSEHGVDVRLSGSTAQVVDVEVGPGWSAAKATPRLACSAHSAHS